MEQPTNQETLKNMDPNENGGSKTNGKGNPNKNGNNNKKGRNNNNSNSKNSGNNNNSNNSNKNASNNNNNNNDISSSNEIANRNNDGNKDNNSNNRRRNKNNNNRGGRGRGGVGGRGGGGGGRGNTKLSPPEDGTKTDGDQKKAAHRRSTSPEGTRGHAGGGDDGSPVASTKQRPPRKRQRKKKRGSNDEDRKDEEQASSQDENEMMVENEDGDEDNDVDMGTEITSTSHFSETRFDSLPSIGSNSKRAIKEVLKYEYLTKVQDATLKSIMEGKDVLAKAKTGTGKTVAFLLPMVEMIHAKAKDDKKANDGKLSGLILSPTRELSLQILQEAKNLCSFHKDISIRCVIGGVNMKKDEQALSNKVNLLVATPGRLIDHLQRNTHDLIQRFKDGLEFLVLDEADRLLDMGFRKEIETILQHLPTERQSLLFSATLPDSVQDIQRLALKKDHDFIDTLSEEDMQTNIQVAQQAMLAPLEKTISLLERVLEEHMEQAKTSSTQCKVMAFFTTARLAGFMAQIFQASGYPILEMHSRKSQAFRTKTAEQFRNSKKPIIMFSSDVSARGVDYPDVSMVVQVGITSHEQYIHRLGRTARGGKGGKGVLILADFERPWVNELEGLPIDFVDVPDLASDSGISSVIKTVERNKELKKAAEQAYSSFLGFYNTHLKRLKLSKPQVVKLANDFSTIMGLKEIPFLEKRTVGKMNLKGVSGLRVR